MLDQNTFMETIQAVTEIIKTAEAPMTDDEKLSYFSDMDLTDEQKKLVLDYLSSPDRQKEPEEESIEKPEALKVYMEEVDRLKKYSDFELNEMYKALLSGDKEMINVILEAWLSKVTDIAGKYVQENIMPGDLIQEGNMALFLKLSELCGALECDMEAELNGAVEEAVMQYASELSGEIELENAVRGKVNLVNEASKLLKEENGHAPTLDELMEYTKLDKDELKDILDMIDKLTGE